MVTWTPYRVPRGSKGSRYELTVDGVEVGVTVQHCGHPTAIWPYYVAVPWTAEIQLAPNGRGFRHLADAKAAAETLWRTR